MIYAKIDFKTKKDLKAALGRDEKIGVFSPSPFPVPKNGTIFLSGPHYPKPHTWYAEAIVVNGLIVSVK
jgi:hypothetical protein